MKLKSVFVGARGLRAGWRLLIFVTLFKFCHVMLQTALAHVAPSVLAPKMALGEGEFTPQGLLTSEIENLVSLAIAIAVMTLIERRTLDDYGLRRAAMGKRVCEGMAWGLAMVTAMVLLQRVERVFDFGTVAISGSEALRMGVLWRVATLCMALFEEIGFRGYIQCTLASGMGFWPAAMISSAIFGASHIAGDTSYDWQGFFSAMLFGLLYCLTLKRTGSVWMAIGFHAAADFAEIFLFSPQVPNFVTVGHLLNCTVQGPIWLTGGSVGPEASINGLILFTILFAVFGVYRFSGVPARGLAATRSSRTA